MGASIFMGSPTSMALLFSVHITSLGLAPIIFCGFPHQTFYFPGILHILRSPFQCRFRPHSFMHCLFRDCLSQCLASQAFLRNLGGVSMTP
jgi:hypothetical protein